MIWVLNGPNLDRLGTREPHIYGTATYDDLITLCRDTAAEAGTDVDVRQTADEGELIRWLHEATDARVPVVINAGAWTHTSIAVRDAAAALAESWVEVHISNIHAREEFRHHSYLSAIATGVVVGLGIQGYAAAIRYLAADAAARPPTPG